MLPTERGRELDAAVAVEVMGWREATPQESLMGEWGDERFITVSGELHQGYLSSDNNEVQLVESEIERRGLVEPYIRHMLAQVADADAYWQLLRATSEQRCLAALAAVREARGATNAD